MYTVLSKNQKDDSKSMFDFDPKKANNLPISSLIFPKSQVVLIKEEKIV